MLVLEFTARFKWDYKRAKKQGGDLSKLRAILEALQRGDALPARNRDHDLSGSYLGHRECHIESDWLLFYRVEAERLVLTAVRTGPHSDLLGM